MEGMSIRYSEAFKLQVIKELRSGKLSNIKEARERYGIIGSGTVRNWLKKYNCQDLLPKRVRVEMPDERDVIKQLKCRIQDLEKALADTRIKELLNQSHFEILCEQMGIKDIDGQKKKIEEQQSREV